jgi:hypothetical protein
MRALLLVGVVLASTDPRRHEEGLAMIDAARRAAERLGSVYLVSLAANQLGARLRALGRFEVAEERHEMAAAYAETHRLALNECWPASELWHHRWLRGEWDVALAQTARLRRFVDEAHDLTMFRATVQVLLAGAHIDLGQLAEALTTLEGRERSLELVDEPQARVPYLRERLRIAVLQGDDEAADRCAYQVIDCLGQRSTHSEEVPGPLVTVCRWLAGRPSKKARTGVERCLLALTQAEHQFGSLATHAARLEGEAALAGSVGTASQAARLYLAAASQWEACGYPLDEARARCSAAERLGRIGEAEEADAERRRADSLLRGLRDRLPSGPIRSSFERVRRHMIGKA